MCVRVRRVSRKERDVFFLHDVRGLLCWCHVNLVWRGRGCGACCFRCGKVGGDRDMTEEDRDRNDQLVDLSEARVTGVGARPSPCLLLPFDVFDFVAYAAVPADAVHAHQCTSCLFYGCALFFSFCWCSSA